MTTSPLSLRLPTALREKVESIAALEHRSLADTLRMLAEEAITMREFPDVIFTSGPTGRRASFRRGPDVWEILEPYVLATRSGRSCATVIPILMRQRFRLLFGTTRAIRTRSTLALR
jgi:hypothetical protein